MTEDVGWVVYVKPPFGGPDQVFKYLAHDRHRVAISNCRLLSMADISKIRGGGGIAGALFAIGSMLIFLIGIPRLLFFLPAAIILGCGVALILRFVRRETPGKPWILSSTQDTDSTSSTAQATDNPPEDLRHNLHVLSPA
jgi:Putative transposase